MKRWHRVVALAVGLVLINAATQRVIRANFSAGLYPTDADSIGIPIMTTLYLSLALSPWLLMLAFFSTFQAVRAYCARGGMLVIAVLVVLYVPALAFALGGIAYWAAPNHYAIAWAFAVLLLVLVALAWDDARALRAAMPAGTTAPDARPAVPATAQHTWYAIGLALFLYALPFIHNLGCIDVPFNTGHDLALLYLGLPAAVVAIFGGRWIGTRIGWLSARAGALLAGTALFVWIVVLGQAYVLLANALLSPQRPVLYEGVVVDKLRSGFRERNYILHVQLASATHDVISMEVNENEYSRLRVGDRVAKPMMLGALHVPYIARCRWLPSARHG